VDFKSKRNKNTKSNNRMKYQKLPNEILYVLWATIIVSILGIAILYTLI